MYKIKKILLVLILGAVVLIFCMNETKDKSKPIKEIIQINKSSSDFLSEKFIENYTYISDNEKIKLVDSNLKNEYGNYSIVEYSIGDINKDGIQDLFILLVNNSQGSGSFYFTNLFIGKASGELKFIEEKFIGDRIKANYIAIYQAKQKHPITNIDVNAKDYGVFSLGYYTYAKNQPFSEDPKIFMSPEWKMIDGKVERINQE